MNREEWLRYASDALDEEPCAAASETPSIDGEAFAAHLVARHLETSHPVLPPADFRATTMRAIARTRSRHTFLLIGKVAFVAGAIMSCAVASAFGFDLWNGLFGAIEIGAFTTSLHNALRTFASGLNTAVALFQNARPIWWLLPFPLLAAALFAAFAEVALFRVIHLGPFRAGRSVASKNDSI